MDRYCCTGSEACERGGCICHPEDPFTVCWLYKSSGLNGILQNSKTKQLKKSFNIINIEKKWHNWSYRKKPIFNTRFVFRCFYRSDCWKEEKNAQCCRSLSGSVSQSFHPAGSGAAEGGSALSNHINWVLFASLNGFLPPSLSDSHTGGWLSWSSGQLSGSTG